MLLNLHVKLLEDGGPDVGVRGACVVDKRAPVMPISAALLKPKVCGDTKQKYIYHTENYWKVLGTSIATTKCLHTYIQTKTHAHIKLNCFCSCKL